MNEKKFIYNSNDIRIIVNSLDEIQYTIYNFVRTHLNGFLSSFILFGSFFGGKRKKAHALFCTHGKMDGEMKMEGKKTKQNSRV